MIDQRRHIVNSLSLAEPGVREIVFRFPRTQSGRLPAAGKPSSGINGPIVAAPVQLAKSVACQWVRPLTLRHKW
jgi:hypothetical protein